MTDMPTPPPEAQLLQLLFGFMVSKGISTAASLNVADALGGGPLYYTELARTVGADQRALHRLLRMLVAVGVFAEPEPGTFALTPVSELLRTDVKGSLRDMAVMITSAGHWRPWGRFEDVVRTGDSGAQHAFGTDVFSWFQRDENKGEWEVFNRAMSSFSSSVSDAVAAAYDWSSFRRVIDIGGGHGHLLRAILEVAPQASGLVVDLPGVVATFPAAPGGRIQAQAGDFFDSVPKGGDCYVMKHIIHDWSDDHCRRLLANIVAAMSPEGRVVVIEIVMPEGPEPHPAKFMDLNMLAMTEGGCERTAREFADLFAASGLRLVAIHPTKGPVSIVEAARA